MRTIRDFYRPAERSSNNRNNNRGSGGGKILAVLIIVALVGFAWAQPSVAGKMVGKAIQATSNVVGQWLPGDSEDAPLAVTGDSPEDPNADLMALPVSGVVVRNFVAVDESGEARYDGVDIKSQPGQDVQSAAAGTVVQITEVDGEWLVILQHPQNIETRYGGLASAQVKVGDKVTLGQAIGKAGDTPVYFAIYQNGEPLDPLTYLQKAEPSA